MIEGSVGSSSKDIFMNLRQFCFQDGDTNHPNHIPGPVSHGPEEVTLESVLRRHLLNQSLFCEMRENHILLI